ncbi:MAG TPA: alpha/beta hydrolase [Saliniramus sp.]|nr:alpha/beta hydrolase [Saliniramus sp.]HMB10427.1 alpha/beta hydrolase [Saliniramus sp.]
MNAMPSNSQVSDAFGFRHVFVPASKGHDQTPPLLFLHGTGGDERDLLPLAGEIAPGAAILSLRGNVSENDMPRFFRRLAEGVFDEADLRAQTQALAAFIDQACAAYALSRPVAVGFSNGANIAASLLWLAPENLAGAALWRVMRPLPQAPGTPLSGKPVLILAGASDPLIPAARSQELALALGEAGAAVSLEILPAGHGLTPADLAITARFLAGSGKAGASEAGAG